VVIASALTGLAVIRMYFSLFCGRSEVLVHPSLRLGLRPREAWTFVALVVALLGLGLLPRPLVDSRFDASDQILRLRQERVVRLPVGAPRSSRSSMLTVWSNGQEQRVERSTRRHH
jgi:NADH:ubiquinone oxidoreductase subunit 4 (subunit M)